MARRPILRRWSGRGGFGSGRCCLVVVRVDGDVLAANDASEARAPLEANVVGAGVGEGGRAWTPFLLTLFFFILSNRRYLTQGISLKETLLAVAERRKTRENGSRS